MYYGMKRCETFGGYMNVGYVPDSFGQAGNMPQIYQSFGIKDSLFWRGVSDDMVKHTDYIWRGDDGSEVFVTQIPFGYYIGGNIPEEELKSEEFWQKECFEKAGAEALQITSIFQMVSIKLLYVKTYLISWQSVEKKIQRMSIISVLLRTILQM